MYHRTMLCGRLGRDPEQRFTANGTAVTTMSIAVDDGFGDNKTTIWYRVTAWKQTAEACAKYLHKGDIALCEGRMRATEPWQDREGNWRSSLEMTADRVQFIQTQRQEEPEAKPDTSTVDDVESIPF